MSSVIVIGSLNMDLVVQAPHLPAAGETISGSDLHFIHGGKGGNQAVAAARLGCDVAMIAKVGSDQFGKSLISALDDAGVDANGVSIDPQSVTGTAVIVVADNGENQIVVSPAANYRLTPTDIEAAEELIANAKMVALQFEIPQDTIRKAIEIANKHNVEVLINCAPFTETQPGFYSGVNILVVNEVEAQALSGKLIKDVESAREASRVISTNLNVPKVIITLGADGAVATWDGESIHVPSVSVNAIDTTAAGDAFIGGLIAARLRGLPLLEVLEFANATGAITTTRLGAQTSLPTVVEVESLLHEYRCNEGK
ncbi:MAG: ribokinase [Anaerolineaceae bacterium]